MKTLQNKAFWRRKPAVLENQLLHVENRLEIASERKKTETLLAYACNGFSEIHPKIARESLESRLEPLGGLEKPTKALLGSSWETLGRLLGTSRGALGSPREPFRSVLVASWESFGASWARIWSPRHFHTPLRHDLGSKIVQKRSPNRLKMILKTCLI